MPACCVSFQLSLMKSVFPLPTEQLQRWIGQNLRGSGSRKFPISYPVLASSFALGRDQAPVSRQAWTIGAADKNVVIEVPNRCLVCNSIVERIIGLAVPVEVCNTDHVPVSWKGWTIGAADKNGVI